MYFANTDDNNTYFMRKQTSVVGFDPKPETFSYVEKKFSLYQLLHVSQGDYYN